MGRQKPQTCVLPQARVKAELVFAGPLPKNLISCRTPDDSIQSQCHFNRSSEWRAFAVGFLRCQSPITNHRMSALARSFDASAVPVAVCFCQRTKNFFCLMLRQFVAALILASANFRDMDIDTATRICFEQFECVTRRQHSTETSGLSFGILFFRRGQAKTSSALTLRPERPPRQNACLRLLPALS